MENMDSSIVTVRRQWNSWRRGGVALAKLSGLHWGTISGGVGSRAPQPFVFGYVACSEIDGKIDHSCAHGEGPHNIKVCLVKRDNQTIWNKVLALAGPKPEKSFRGAFL